MNEKEAFSVKNAFCLYNNIPLYLHKSPQRNQSSWQVHIVKSDLIHYNAHEWLTLDCITVKCKNIVSIRDVFECQ